MLGRRLPIDGAPFSCARALGESARDILSRKDVYVDCELERSSVGCAADPDVSAMMWTLMRAIEYGYHNTTTVCIVRASATNSVPQVG